MSKIMSLILASLLTFAFSQNGFSQASHRKIVRDYERKILEKEKTWQLANKRLGEKYSENVWKAKDGVITVEIIKYGLPEEALRRLRAIKTAHAAGGPRDVQGLGDAAYEHIQGPQKTVHSITFVKGGSLVTIVPDSSEKVGVETIRRFARHVLDAIEGK